MGPVGGFCSLRKWLWDQTLKVLDMGFVQSITNFIDALICNNTKENTEAMKTMSTEEIKMVYDAFFIFAVMWSIGGAIANDKTINRLIDPLIHSLIAQSRNSLNMAWKLSTAMDN